MHAIKSIQQLEKLIDGYIESHKSVFNNFYLFEPEIKRLISQERLFCDMAQGGLFFFCDEGPFCRLYFYVNTGDIINVSEDKPVVCEILLSEGREEQERVIEQTMQKFRLNKTSRMYSLKVKENESFTNEQYDSLINSLGGEFELRYAAAGDIPALRRFWEHDLDPYDFPFMSRDELLSCLDAGEVAVAQSRDGGLVATVWRAQKGNASITQHLAVSESMRGKKLGRLMMLWSLKKDVEENTSVHTCWLDITNVPTLRLHTSLNFAPTKRLSMQFVK